MRTPESIIIKPLITEKMLSGQEEGRQYAFKVLQNANKIEIKRAIESKFNVDVEKVRTISVKGKRKRMNTRRGLTFGRRPSWKKAVVTLAEGSSTIDFFETLG